MEDGAKGAQGEPGADGNFGGATFDYTFRGLNGSTPVFTPLGNGDVFGFEILPLHHKVQLNIYKFLKGTMVVRM